MTINDSDGISSDEGSDCDRQLETKSEELR